MRPEYGLWGYWTERRGRRPNVEGGCGGNPPHHTTTSRVRNEPYLWQQYWRNRHWQQQLWDVVPPYNSRPTNKRSLLLEVCGRELYVHSFNFLSLVEHWSVAMALVVGGSLKGGNPPSIHYQWHSLDQNVDKLAKNEPICSLYRANWVISSVIIEIVDILGGLGRIYWNI